jgi:hypothetical protein
MQLLLADLSKAVNEKTEAEEKAKMFKEEKLNIEHKLADIIRRQKMKMEEDKLKMKRIKKYARGKENFLHYALVVVILISVVIALI